jgi:hypothetical protein
MPAEKVGWLTLQASARHGRMPLPRERDYEL